MTYGECYQLNEKERQEIKDSYERIFKNDHTDQLEPKVRSILEGFVWQWTVYHGLWGPIDEKYPPEGFQKTFPYPNYDWEVRLIARHKNGKELNRAKSYHYKKPGAVCAVIQALDDRMTHVYAMNNENQALEELFKYAYEHLWLPLKEIEMRHKKAKVVKFVYDMHTSILKCGNYDRESLRSHIDRRDKGEVLE